MLAGRHWPAWFKTSQRVAGWSRIVTVGLAPGRFAVVNGNPAFQCSN